MLDIKKIVNKYKAIPITVKAAIWFAICNILQNGLHLITMPIYTRMLTTEQYGISTLFFAWMDIVVVFASLRLAAGVFNNGMVHYPEDRDRFQASMQGLSTLSSLICLLIYGLFFEFFNNLFRLPPILIVMMFLYFIFYPSITYWTARQRYEYKYVGFTVATLGMAILTSLMSVVFIIIFENKGVMKIVGYLLAASIINIVFYIYNFAKGKIFYDKKYWLFALKFNVPLIPHYLSMIILNQCDRIMIGRMCGEGEAAIYGVAYNIGKIALIFNSAITATFTPWIYEKLKSKDYNDCEKISFSLFSLITGIVIMIMLFGPEVIYLFATKEYMEAIYVIPPIAAGAYFTFVYNQVSTVEFFYGKSKYIMYASVLGALANIVLNYYAISWFGYIAAAYTSLICYIFFAVCHYALMSMLCKKNRINKKLFSGKKILFLSIGVLIFTLFVNILYSYIVVRYMLISVLLIIAFIFRKKILAIILDLKNK